jgi:hypothetical protein
MVWIFHDAADPVKGHPTSEVSFVDVQILHESMDAICDCYIFFTRHPIASSPYEIVRSTKMPQISTEPIQTIPSY